MSDHRYITLGDAALLAESSTGLAVRVQDIQRLLDLGIIPNFGDTATPTVLADHAHDFGAVVGSALDIAAASIESGNTLPGQLVHSNVLLRLTPSLAISYDHHKSPAWAVRAFIHAIRPQAPRSLFSDWSAVTTVLPGGMCVWSSSRPIDRWWREQWELALADTSRTSTAEAACVPSLYGNKGRLSQFIVSTIRQSLAEGAWICDLMCGTGLVTRQLLPHYNVHANDAALFATTLAASQVVEVSEERARELLRLLRDRYEENMSVVARSLGPALEIEDSYLVGSLSESALKGYRSFMAACTRFVPGYVPAAYSLDWPERVDAHVRQNIVTMVDAARASCRDVPAILTTAYWGNCYFGLRQASEIDSLRRAIGSIESPRELPLLEAVLLAAADACTSGPHYAQPPKTNTDPHLRIVIDRRARSVIAEFELRLQLAAKRRPRGGRLNISQLSWQNAVAHFAGATTHLPRGVYVDPPYSRLQYSRFYHVFDTLLRYDYPLCEGEGRTSEKSRRFSSRFDSQQSSAISEFHDLCEAIKDIDALLFLSYATKATVPVEVLLASVRKCFRSVDVYAIPIRHHSQGTSVPARGHRLEILIVGSP